MSVVRTLLLEAAFHRRTLNRIRWPDRWARKVADTVVADAQDPERLAARGADIDRKVAMARRMAPDSADVSLEHLVDRLLLGRLEDGTTVTGAHADELIETARYVIGHGYHDACPTCALREKGDARAYLRAAGCDPVLLRILHHEAVAAEILPAYPVKTDPNVWRPSKEEWSAFEELMGEAG
jgi:hypothetical protein